MSSAASSASSVSAASASAAASPLDPSSAAAANISLFESVFSNSTKTDCIQLLSNLAASDGHHDQPQAVDQTTIAYLGKGLPGIPSADSVEGEVETKAFKSILIDKDFFPGMSFTNYIKSKINRTIDIGISSSNKPLHKYLTGHMQLEASSNRDGGVVPDRDPSAKFAEILRLTNQTTKILFSVDFNHHSFVENLLRGTIQPNPIYIITAPPTINDPGPKINPFDKTIFKQEHTQGYQICSVVETATDDLGTDYTPYDVNLASPNNMFVSKYNINLSPLKQIITGKTSKFTTDMVISYSPSDNLKPYIATITNSGDNNSNSIIKAKLTSILAKLRSLTGSNEAKKNIEYFNFNEKLAEKRSGDFLQAQFLLDLKNRSFMQIIPPSRQPINFKDDSIGFFVTHDLVAASYALFLGINLIFLDYYGNVFIFKNIQDFERVGNKINIYKMLFDNFKTHKNFVKLVITNAILYSYAYNGATSLPSNGATDIPSIIEVYKGKIAGSFETIKSNIDELMRENSQLKFLQYFQRTLIVNLRILFSQLVEFTYFTLIFPKLDLTTLEYMKTFFQQNIQNEHQYVAAAALDDQIESFNKYYSNLVGIDNKLQIPRDVTNNVDLFQQIQRMIVNWINNNVQRLDLFIAAKTLFISDQLNTDIDEKYVRELNISLVHGKSKEVDRHIFLPYIEKLNFNGKEMLDSQLSDLNRSMIPLMDKYKRFVFNEDYSLLDKVNTFFRGGKLPPTQRLYYKVCSFLIDSQIFCSNMLKINPNNTIAENIANIKSLSEITPVIQESNLVTEDLSDIQKFASQGGKDVDSFYDGDKAIQVKGIDLTSDIYIERIEHVVDVDGTYQANVEMAGGAGLYSFYLQKEHNSRGSGIRTVGNGFDDSSDNFHITRPYLTYILTDTTTEPILNADIVKICEEEAGKLGIDLRQNIPSRLDDKGEYNINYLNALLTKIQQTRRVKPNFISTKVGGGSSNDKQLEALKKRITKIKQDLSTGFNDKLLLKEELIKNIITIEKKRENNPDLDAPIPTREELTNYIGFLNSQLKNDQNNSSQLESKLVSLTSQLGALNTDMTVTTKEQESHKESLNKLIEFTKNKIKIRPQIDYLTGLLTQVTNPSSSSSASASASASASSSSSSAASFSSDCKLSNLQKEKDLKKIDLCLDNLLNKLNSAIRVKNPKLIDEILDDILNDSSVIREYPMKINQLLIILKNYKENELNLKGIYTEKIEGDLLLIISKILDCETIIKKIVTNRGNMGGGSNHYLQHGGANENLLDTFIYGFHPLLPLYIQFSAFWYSISPKMQYNNAFYDEFISYYTILTKMITVLCNNYLNDPNDDIKVLQAYLIGFGLKTLLQSSFNDDKELKAVLEVVGINTSDPIEMRKYSAFSSKNSMFTNLFIGRIIEDENDVEKSCNFVQTQIFKDFITRDIGLKDMLNMGTEIVDYTALQNQVFAQLQIISDKIALDRGNTNTSKEVTSNTGTTKEVISTSSNPNQSLIPYNPSDTFLPIPGIKEGISGSSTEKFLGGKKTIKRRNKKRKIAFSKNKKNKLKHKKTHKKKKHKNYKYKKTR